MLNLKVRQLRDDIVTVRSGTHIRVNRKNAAVGPDVKRLPSGMAAWS
jgi:hypothetical protein